MPERLKAMLARLQASGIFLDEHEPRARFRLSDNSNMTPDGERRLFEPIDEDENFLYVTYRALSMARVSWCGLVLDFTEPDVLKRSVKLLQGQTVYTDHDTRVENWMGAVAQTKWDESQGIPPGINSRLKLNKKWSSAAKNDIILGVRLGTIHSVSVDVVFEYRKSHPDLDSYEFFTMQGEEINGSIVRLIVTGIIGYGEESLVWQGADRHAKQQRIIQVSSDGGMGLERGTAKPKIPGGNNVKLSRLFATLFNLDLERYGLTAGKDEVDLDQAGQSMLMGDLVRANNAMNGKIDEMNAMLRDFVGDIVPDKFKAALAALAERAKMGDQYLAAVREDALANAKLAEGKSEDEKFGESALAKMIMGADLASAIQLRDDYRKKAEEKFPLVCTSCGAKLVRASASREGEPSGNTPAIDVEDYKM